MSKKYTLENVLKQLEKISEKQDNVLERLTRLEVGFNNHLATHDKIFKVFLAFFSVVLGFVLKVLLFP